MKSHKKNLSQLLQYIIYLLSLLLLISCEVVVDNETQHDDGDGAKNQNYSASEPFSYNIEIINQNYLRLNTINGNIEIIGIDNGTSINISGDRIVKSDSHSDAEEHLEYLQVEIFDNENDIVIKTDQPNESNGREYIINYYIEIPSNWQVSIDHVNGGIDITNIKNDLDISLVNGTTDLDDITGNVNVSIVNGTFTGYIIVPLNGYCRLNLVNGILNLNIPKTTSADFNAFVVTGSIHLNGLVLKNLNTTPTHTSGILGEGSGDISIEIVNGPITVNGF
jgi:DUF4097 and DUF4098 domain-containing protein YvlB